MCKILSRIKQIALNEDTTIGAIERKIGASKGVLSRAIAKGTDIQSKWLELIVENYPHYSGEWLLTGKGQMLMSTDLVAPEISYTDGVPYYNETFECGFDELVSPNTENPEYLIQMPGYENATLWCNASGHSMEPEINHGDIIALQRIIDFSFLPFGDIYGFVTTNGMRTIKRLGRSVRDGYYKLIPTNKEYDEQEIPIDKILMVYRVMGAMKAF
ncbi:S24 family peptidase [Paramuribaculum intestinale]|jgi:phage repressor protein C with HTH and peptisase S24 domain|uniref:S24 family peptidase n=1 Tax=Paramuribaculum intestinale TaxID=2094151 RepID=UPI0025B10BE2|nr:S24 family peptidase [Paramuribaculum intestinale]